MLALSRAKRHELAAALAAESVQASDVLALRDYLFDCIDDKAKCQRTLAAKLIEPTGRREMFDDLRAMVAKRGAAKVAEQKQDGPPGESIRAADTQRVRKFEAQWAQFERDRAAGKLPPFERRAMPWEFGR